MPSKSPKFGPGTDTLASCFESGLGMRPQADVRFQPPPPMLEQLAALAAAVAIDRWAHPAPPVDLIARSRYQSATLNGLRDWMKAGGFSSEPGAPEPSAEPVQPAVTGSGTGSVMETER